MIPARDEAPRVAAVIAEIQSILPNTPVVVVVNGSTDHTASVAKAAGATVLFAPAGYARALKIGFCYALQQSPPWVIQMDADGQHPAAALPALLQGLASSDVVIASRFMGVSGYTVPLARRLAIQGLAQWASWWAGQPLRDVTSGMRAWRPEALAKIADDFPEDIADANLLVRVLRRGLSIQEIPVAMRARHSGRSMHQGPSGVWFAARMALLTVQEATKSGSA